MTKDMGRQFNKILNQAETFEKTKGSYRRSYLDDFFRYRTQSDLYWKELSMLDELERALFFLTSNDTCELLKAKGDHWWKYFDDNRQKLTDYIPNISLYDKTFEAAPAAEGSNTDTWPARTHMSGRKSHRL
jgi:hypothetical protein